MSEVSTTKQPRAIYMLFFAEMWERFSYYGMRALLILYMTSQLAMGDKDGTAILAAYAALVYATPFIGGFVADNLLGHQKAVLLGGTLMAIGHFMMAFEDEFFLYVALSFLVVGNGFFKPNLASMVGGLYHEGDSRRDGGFTIYYIGVNLGAFLAPLICGTIGEGISWHLGFTLAGIGMVAGLIVFWRGQRQLAPDNGVPPSLERLHTPMLPQLKFLTTERTIYLFSLLGVPLIALLINLNELMDFVLIGLTLIALGYVLYEAFRSDKVTRERLLVIPIMLIFLLVFMAFFEQAASSLNLFTDRNVDREILGITIPASVFQSVNPMFILIFGPVFTWLWVYLQKRRLEPPTTIKFALGLLQLGLGFGLLVLGAITAGESGMTALIFLVLSYLFQTTGELCIQPVGLSMVTKLAPKRMVAIAMGVWFIAISLAQHVAGLIAGMTSTDQYTVQGVVYTPDVGKTGVVSFSIVADDNGEDELTSDTVKVVVEVTDAAIEEAEEKPLPTSFVYYASLAPGEEGEYEMRVPYIDPTGDLTELRPEGELPEGAKLDTEAEMITYKAPENFEGQTVINYTMVEKEGMKREFPVDLTITVDLEDNHLPEIKQPELHFSMKKREMFSKFLGEASLGIDLQEVVVDVDGDPISYQIVEKPEMGQAKVTSTLQTFVTPERTNLIYSRVYNLICWFAVGAGIILILLSPLIRKWMHGVH